MDKASARYLPMPRNSLSTMNYTLSETNISMIKLVIN
jgi:hypothetical protein